MLRRGAMLVTPAYSAAQVGRNCDRGDAAKLPPEQLDLCEIEPLRLEEPGSNRYVCIHAIRCPRHSCESMPLESCILG